ncbi:hypothetical protein DFJ73DRAFT_967434 [Zopfochytrium polystomum]|nr:hypothetical protein DFJ73DRAFT_967434 [Zopfochytrium polystomum]
MHAHALYVSPPTILVHIYINVLGFLSTTKTFPHRTPERVSRDLTPPISTHHPALHLAFPTLHYVLLTQFPRLPHASIALIVGAGMAFAAVLVRTATFDVQMHVITLYWPFTFVLLKSAAVARDAAARWSLGDYVRFRLTQTIRTHAGSATTPCTVVGCCVRRPLTATRLAATASRLALVAAAHFFALAYYEKRRPFAGGERALASPADPRALMDTLACGIMVFATIEITTLPLALLYEAIFDCHVSPSMAAPFAATTFADFWRGWNTPVQLGLDHGVFRPLLRILTPATPRTSAKPAPPPASSRAAAAFLTFLMSGVLHEWMLLMTPAGFAAPGRVCGASLAFFAAHGALCVVDALVFGATAAGRRAAGHGVVRVARRVACVAAIAATAPLFVGPLIDAGVMALIEQVLPFPAAWKDGVKRMLP